MLAREQVEVSSDWSGVSGKAAKLCSELVLCVLQTRKLAEGSSVGPGQSRVGCNVGDSSREIVL